MKHAILFVGALTLLGFGCTQQSIQAPSEEPSTENVRAVISDTPTTVPTVILPVENYVNRRTLKAFGEYIEDRFIGYHTGDDVEFADQPDAEVSIKAIADGVIRHSGTAPGYGGIVVIDHDIDGSHLNGVYGHLDPQTIPWKKGSPVKLGDHLGFLGDHESEATDGERKHLHFALYQGDFLQIAGYTGFETTVAEWLNPQNFFASRGIDMFTNRRTFDPTSDRGADNFQLSFLVPSATEIEYVPQIDAQSIFTLSGDTSARQRSLVFIQKYEADAFTSEEVMAVLREETEPSLTSNGVLTKEWEVKRRSGTSKIEFHPDWRTERQHIVIDVKDPRSNTYYRFAMHPDMDRELVDEIIQSVTF